MIVRDEERDLARCLRSARGVADELCVVDTGSRDRTVDVALSFGAEVRRMDWRDDFSAARNASLELAGGDWVLVLDADEELGPGARSNLDAFVKSHPESAGRVWIVDSREGSESRSPVTRFFPRWASPEFRGRVHEQLLLNGAEPARADTGIEVLHRGYSAHEVERKGKLERNVRLLRLALEDGDDDAYLWYQLGRTLAFGERHIEALEAFARALDRAAGGEPFFPHLVESTGYTLRALDRSREAYDLLLATEAAGTSRADTCFLAALLAMDVGDLAEAEAGFRRCLGLAGTSPGGGPHSPLASTVGPAHNLGVMNEVLGLTEESRTWYRRALAFQPDHGPSRAGLDRLAVRQAEHR